MALVVSGGCSLPKAWKCDKSPASVTPLGQPEAALGHRRMGTVLPRSLSPHGFATEASAAGRRLQNGARRVGRVEGETIP